MSRFIWVLVWLGIIFTGFKYLNYASFGVFKGFLKTFKDSVFYQTVFIAGITIFVLFYLLEYLNSTPVNGPGKFYAAQISTNDYEAQKRSFTQKKLAELFNTKEYQDYIRHKNLNQTPKIHEILESEDEF